MFLKKVFLLLIDFCLIVIVFGLAKNLVSIESAYIKNPPEHTKTELTTIPTLEKVKGVMAPTQISSKPPTPTNSPMLSLVNAERQSRGLPPLTLDQSLTAVAQKHSENMAQNNFFSHTDPSGKTPVARLSEASITFQTAGENIAYAPSVEVAHQNLMNSEEHRSNILSPSFRKIGIGAATQNPGKTLFTEVFTN